MRCRVQHKNLTVSLPRSGYISQPRVAASAHPGLEFHPRIYPEGVVQVGAGALYNPFGVRLVCYRLSPGCAAVGGKDMGNTLARTLVTGALPSVQRLRVTAIAPWPVRPEVRAVPVSMHNRRLLHGPDPPPAPTRPSGPHPPGCDDPAN